MKNKKYENYQDFIIAFDSTPEEMIKKETYDLLKLYNQTQQQLQAYKDKEDKLREITPLELAIHFHNTYERLAPQFGYETREDTKQFDIQSNNGQLMVAVCETILNDTLQILNEGVDTDE